eukprot:GEMP01029666.1.p1 GENE.GEMP01029666.1~~GEMP01029666.1.p1  ORF type:complete len:513 (+),score=82.03 GEMP01029666.1:282-1820(+)
MPANRAPAISGTVTGAGKYNIVPSGYHQPGAVVHAANNVHVTTKKYYSSPHRGSVFSPGRTSSMSSLSLRSINSPPGSPPTSRSRSPSPNRSNAFAAENVQQKPYYGTLFAAINDPASHYRHLSPVSNGRSEVRAHKTMLARPQLPAKKKRKSVESKQANETPMKKTYVVPPFKRYRTTYVDVFHARNPRTEIGGMGNVYNTFDPLLSPKPLPGHRKTFKHVRSRVMDHLPPCEKLTDDEKITIRNTRLCYTERKYTRHHCDHFNVAQQVRKMDTEHRRLMRLKRLVEIGDHRTPTECARGLRLRRQARKEAYEDIRDASRYLKQLEKVADPMDKERERADWQIAVAERRLAIADAMDRIDNRIETGKREEDEFPLPLKPYMELDHEESSFSRGPDVRFGSESRFDVLPYERRRDFSKSEGFTKGKPSRRTTTKGKDSKQDATSKGSRKSVKSQDNRQSRVSWGRVDSRKSEDSDSPYVVFCSPSQNAECTKKTSCLFLKLRIVNDCVCEMV